MTDLDESFKAGKRLHLDGRHEATWIPVPATPGHLVIRREQAGGYQQGQSRLLVNGGLLHLAIREGHYRVTVLVRYYGVKVGPGWHEYDGYCDPGSCRDPGNHEENFHGGGGAAVFIP